MYSSALLRPELTSAPLDAHNFALLREATARTQNERFVQANEKQVERTNTGGYYSALTGRVMGGFDHSNMKPYTRVRGSVASATTEDTNTRRFEMFDGYAPQAVAKQEAASFFDVSRSVTTGMASTSDFVQSRVEESTLRNGVLPFQQEKVGPGLGVGSEAGPSGGYHQFENAEYARPKTVDDMRVASKPRVTFATPVVEGQRGNERGMLPAPRMREDLCERTDFLPNSAPFQKEAGRPEVDPRVTHRGQGANYHLMPGGTATYENRDGFSATLKKTDANFGSVTSQLAGPDAGYDREAIVGSISLPTTLKEMCLEAPKSSMLTAPFKAFAAPITSALRRTRKAISLMAQPEFPNLDPQMPSKLAVGPTDGLRTTVRETTLEPSQPVNLHGPERGPVGNSDEARTTVKETAQEAAQAGNMTAHRSGPVVDTTQTPRTTGRETMLHDTVSGPLGNLALGPVYDPLAVAKATGRETLEAMDHDLNLKGDAKPQARNGDKARTTVRETLVHTPALGAAQGPSKRLLALFRAKATQRETTGQTEYLGSVAGRARNARPAFQLRATARELTSLHEHFGAADSSNKAMPSMEAIENARTNELKEILSTQREPATQGPKNASTHEALRLTRPGRPEVEQQQEVRYQTSAGPSQVMPNLTREKEQVLNAGRLDPALVGSLRDNPYAVPLMRKEAAPAVYAGPGVEDPDANGVHGTP